MIETVDTVRTGRQLRALRHRQRLTQDDVAERSGMSRSQVGRAERGRADELRLVQLGRIARALGARLDLRVNWNGEALEQAAGRRARGDRRRRHRDLGNARLGNRGRGLIQRACERGSIDILARHPPSNLILVVEVKSVVPDVQAMVMTLDRKARLAPIVARGLGWPFAGIARVLVVSESRTSRRRVEAHGALFDSAFPARTVEVRRWLAHPDARTALRGIWFLSSGRPAAARHRVSRPSRRSPSRSRTSRAELASRSSPKGHSEAG
jgi:transcriptional regulator with XRE-family HTH domain